MDHKSIYLGDTRIDNHRPVVEGRFVEIGDEKFYKISNSNQMPDFFMTIVSDSDHWMFISSNGSLSAGRKDRDNALFPYYTVDKIHDYKGITGSRTVLLVSAGAKTYLWEPFTDVSEKMYKVQRNLYKSMYGNTLVFEEINQDLGLGFQYSWHSSEKYGFVRKSFIVNHGGEALRVDVLDGITNILPAGADYNFQNAYSSLLDAYKKNELLPDTKLGLYMLSSIPVDKAEPSESLRATTVWMCGVDKDVSILLSDRQVANFRTGLAVEEEIDIRASRGAYLVNTVIELAANEEKSWMIVAEVNQDSCAVANLNLAIRNTSNLEKLVRQDIDKGTARLRQIVAKADGLQFGNEALCFARHFSNTLYNVMRGGVFVNNYTVDAADFKLFIAQFNRKLSNTPEPWLDQLKGEINYPDLIAFAEQTAKPDLIRICYEYLPLTFSRRHGDPSRPWNQFSIETKNEDGSVKLNYQGNWRDIFQNWEALSISFPEYLESMISKFVNASTADGYNPYRITRDGIDWESPDPHDPWAYIGYWGDHQVIYLQKLLELSHEFHPGKLDILLQKEIFVYANVPYRIKPYSEIIKNPKDTITFDFALNDEIKVLAETTGADGRLLRGRDGEIYKVNLAEKILVSLLAKLSNFIPEAGIWLNTQRPEWNDANNALVGNGVSMVTLYYLRRSLQFWADRFDESSVHEISLSEELATFFHAVSATFAGNISLVQKGFPDSDRRRIADTLGEAATTYRNSIYQGSFSGSKESVPLKELAEFAKVCLAFIDQSISVNKRTDGLYHSYNLISITEKGISIRHLYEMLEGQVAVLSAGYLSVQESLGVLNALRNSSLYRVDQGSYLLYPDRQLPRFVDKNNVPAEKVKASALLSKLLANNDSSVISKDNSGRVHFNGSFRNAALLEDALNRLDPAIYSTLLTSEKAMVLAIFEEIFDHHSFTGRSGTFYGYEGLGSIYWHMVSKLLLAAQECYFRGLKEGAGPGILGELKNHYLEIKAGIGLYKSPLLYGAFPTDAYSHTPGNAGAQQPGMTGQVKEDFLSRMRELGIMVEMGEIAFQPSLLDPKEFLLHDDVFVYYELQGTESRISLQAGQLCFTLCQVPVVYTAGGEKKIVITYNNGMKESLAGHSISKEISAKIFTRSGEVTRVDVFLEI